MIVVLCIFFFTLVTLILVSAILVAKHFFVSSGKCNLTINNDLKIEISSGDKLLGALAEHDIFLPSACGGSGTCGQCKVKVLNGGEVLSTERNKLTRKEIKEHYRLGCQCKVRGDLDLEIPSSIVGAKKMECEIVSVRQVATYIKEIAFKVPNDFKFRAGGYIQIVCPKFELDFSDLKIDEQYVDEWKQRGFFNLRCVNRQFETRAYSMASYPSEGNIVKLNVRIALPPKGLKVNPGIVSSYIFSLNVGDTITVLGPFGEFFARDTDKEMIFIGGGAGMAPMRAHIFDQLLRLNSKRQISFWYGARSLRELFYREDFDKLQKEHPNFSWHVALSEPLPNDDWHGPTGFIHQVLLEQYLQHHETPEDIEYYLCGPKPMIDAVTEMLLNLGVDRDDIMMDDFGA